MAKLSEKQKLLVIGGSALGVCLLAGGGVYWAQGLIAEVNTQIESKKQEIAAADQKIAKIPSTEREVIILRENLGEYVKILPDNKELNEFVTTLNQFARQAGVNAKSLVPMRAARSNTKGVERFLKTEYQYEMTATLWQFLKFMSLVENWERFISITDFQVTRGGDKNRNRAEEDTQQQADAIHGIKLTMEAYEYNGKSSGEEVDIPDYDDKRDGLREEIFKRMQAIRIEKYEHRGAQNRRDIFVDPRERGDIENVGPSPQEQKNVLEKYIGEVQKLQEDFSRIRKPETTLFDRFSLERRVREGIAKLTSGMEAEPVRVTFPPYRLRWQNEVLKPIDDLRTQLAALDKGGDPTRRDPYLPLADMQQLVGDIQRDLNAGNLEEAKIRYESVGTKLSVPPDDPRHETAVLARSLHVKASTAMEFRSLDLKIQGVVVNRDARSGVLLNGQIYEEGEYVNDDLLVKTVQEEQIWFVFKGLTLIRTM